jgi:D-alanyl-lipoteichoic acid acyltransferase DltB (MBOAT superfamily)
MLFNSLAFFLFFPIVTAIYFALPHRWRWLHLLLASCYFYMFFVPVYVLILAGTIVIDYVAGILISGAEGRRRRLYLMASLAANIGVLAFFKYYNFLNATLLQLTGAVGVEWPLPFLGILLPIGLSFHTFQAMSYTIEVYRGRQQPERHFGIYALYVMFYPQLVAGPIERPQNLLPQFHQPHHFSSADARTGLQLMLLGLCKKVVVADTIAPIVNAVYAVPGNHGATALAGATALFAVQIYADFSGYSDIARGAARVMGFDLMVNFNRPYLARSVAEFWKRWHISLSTWFRDYVYISLGGNRVSYPRWQANLLITFLLSGLWHGASWTFVIWGGLNGLYLVASNWTAGLRARLVRWLGLDRVPAIHAAMQLTFVFLIVCVAWVFFRASSLHDARTILYTMASGDGLSPRSALASLSAAGLQRSTLIGAAALAAGLLLFDFAVEHRLSPDWFDRRPIWIRWGAYYAGVALVLALLGDQQFIYFQF